MKAERIFGYCENCNAAIPQGSEYNCQDNYRKGVININSGSMLLPKPIKRKGYSDSHTVAMEGIYCNAKCLHEFLTKKLKR